MFVNYQYTLNPKRFWKTFSLLINSTYPKLATVHTHVFLVPSSCADVPRNNASHPRTCDGNALDHWLSSLALCPTLASIPISDRERLPATLEARTTNNAMHRSRVRLGLTWLLFLSRPDDRKRSTDLLTLFRCSTVDATFVVVRVLAIMHW